MQLINLGNGVKVLLPKINYFLDKIKNDEPFHFLKINHGFLDLFRHTYKKSEFLNLSKLIKNKDFDLVSKDLYNCMKQSSYPNGENIKYYNGVSEHSLNGIKTLIKLYTENSFDKIKIGVSAGVGLDYTFGEYDKNHPIQKNRNELLKVLVNQKTNYYHSGILKHYCLMDELDSLFKLLNELNFDVVFIGPEYFKKFQNLYSIDKFYHIEIPNQNAIESKDSILNSILDIHKDKTILFHSTGHILSAHIANELKDTNIFGFDVGRSFDWAVKDFIEPKRKNGKYDWINARWMNNHKKIYQDYINSLRK